MKYNECFVNFMSESNAIEGEEGLNPGDREAFQMTLSGINSEEELLALHGLLTDHLNADWSGKYRTCDVRVGTFLPPRHGEVQNRMDMFFFGLEDLDSWKAHNMFEDIHPFRDFNGRVGRLIWLSKAIEEGYDFTIPFLQKYYYQTLSRTKETV